MERSASDTGLTVDLALRDDLTGLYNRRYLRRLLSEEWPRLTAEHATLTLLVLDLDEFKPVNDTYGHAAGDRVLRWAADELRRGFRDGDRIIRYGGDEFVVALLDVGAEEARSLAERARAGFAAVTIDTPGASEPATVPISFSIGVASYPADGGRGEDLLAVADRRLYEEKRERRGSGGSLTSALARRKWVAVAVLALAGAALATALWLRSVERPPEPPRLDSATAPALASPAGEATREIVVRDDEELERLRAEVESLRASLAASRGSANSADTAGYEARIQELEGRLATAEQESAAVAIPAGSDVESLTGMHVGERRTRDDLELPAGAVPVTPQAAPAALPPPRSAVSETAPPVDPAAIVAPRLLTAPKVAYPPLARQLRKTAVVELELLVGADGVVVSAERIGAAAGLGFDEAAKNAALAARYAPGTQGGAPVAMKTRLAIRFAL